MLRLTRISITPRHLIPLVASYPPTLEECLEAKNQLQVGPILRLVKHQKIDVCAALVADDISEFKHVNREWRQQVLAIIYPQIYGRDDIINTTPRVQHKDLVATMDAIDATS